MRNPNSLEEVAEIHSLLTDIKKEYTEGMFIQFQNWKKFKLTVV
jgi:hypothetical protein